MPRTPVPNAKDLLPKAVLAGLQRHCSGAVYIPPPETRADRNRRRVAYLHSRRHKPDEVARIVGLSTGHVRSIIRQLEIGNPTDSRPACRIYQTVPQEIVELVQRHISGSLYVPPKASKSELRRAIVRGLLGRGLPVKLVAERCGLSERRVWQIRKDDLDASRSVGKSDNRSGRDPFAFDHPADPSHTPPRVCASCGSPVGPGEHDCDLCRYRAETQREKDTGEIVITRIPFCQHRSRVLMLPTADTDYHPKLLKSEETKPTLFSAFAGARTVL